MNIAEAVAAPRIHHQWLPDEVFAERGLSPDDTVRGARKQRGHKVVRRPDIGLGELDHGDAGRAAGAADPRQRGTLADGY